MNILLIGYQDLFSAGIKYLLENNYPNTTVHIAKSRLEVEGLTNLKTFDTVLLDIISLEHRCLELVKNYIEILNGSPIVVISVFRDEKVIKELIARGIKYFVKKTSDKEELFSAVESACMGGDHKVLRNKLIGDEKSKDIARLVHNSLLKIEKDALTNRQKSVVELLLKFKSNREIALTLGCAESTVKAHVRAAFRALGIKNRLEFFNKIYGKKQLSLEKIPAQLQNKKI